MNIDWETYDSDKIMIGDLVRYWVQPRPHSNVDAAEHWGYVRAFKHGQVIISPAPVEWDHNRQVYVCNTNGPFSIQVRLIRPFEEIKKPGIEDLI